MTKPDDTRWQLDLKDPVLPAARADQILALARARFLADSAGGPRAPERREWVANVLTAAALGTMVLAYLSWTSQTILSLRPQGGSVLWEDASR